MAWKIVLERDVLLFHEILKLCKLKKRRFAISTRLPPTNPVEVENSHYFAVKWELRLARKAGG